MENAFDKLKTVVFSAVAGTMGYEAIWFHNGIENEGIKARVLFSDAGEKEEVSDFDFDYARPVIEYKEEDWQGLKTLVDAKQAQIIKVRDAYYYTLKVISVARDGEVYKVILQEATDL
ncbi:MAG: hypothetical protein JSS64_03510 [Bacteroidetes bacterium]|nr:hypothetical protein [Bacteroidota bacterium]